MKEFYYQIKGKKGSPTRNGLGWLENWTFPPILCGKVEAKDKTAARKKVDELYEKEFPMRVAADDLKSNEFLLSLKEITENDYHVKRLFDVMTCEFCGNKFKVIDKYNDPNCQDKGPRFCSENCREESWRQHYENRADRLNMNGTHDPVIYKITNKKTGLCYIGKTTQAVTLRWWQHFYQGSGGDKFQKEIKNTNITDWTFEVIEIIKPPKDYKDQNKINDLILEREQFHIQEHNSIENGYNSVTSKKILI